MRCAQWPHYHFREPDVSTDETIIGRVDNRGFRSQHLGCQENGMIKPTHMMVAMSKDRSKKTIIYKHASPEFCVRWSDSPGA